MSNPTTTFHTRFRVLILFTSFSLVFQVSYFFCLIIRNIMYIILLNCLSLPSLFSIYRGRNCFISEQQVYRTVEIRRLDESTNVYQEFLSIYISRKISSVTYVCNLLRTRVYTTRTHSPLVRFFSMHAVMC